MNKYSGVRAMMLTGAILLLIGGVASGGGETVLYVNEAASKSFATLNCKAPGWAKGYPCLTGDPASEVGSLISQVENHLLADPFCEGIQYVTKPPASKPDWELEIHIAFVDENRPPQWILIPENRKEPSAHGYDQPPDMAHIVCGIISHKGMKRIN
jgi:hypothetical protein